MSSKYQVVNGKIKSPLCGSFAELRSGNAQLRRACRWLLFFVFTFTFSLSFASPQLSEKSFISLLTCSPGKELYSAFGHSAIRVADPENGIDRTYNYGTFDFDQPDFYSNYAKGRPLFMLSVASTRNFLGAYVYENRSVQEDILNLSQEQKQRMFELLEENYLPENRNYRYDYIYDNCATRIRDLILSVADNKIIFDTFPAPPASTFRELMRLYLQPQPWGAFGIDLALSSVIDTPAPPYYRMFLPDYLQKGFEHARFSEGNPPAAVVKSSRVIYTAEPEAPEKFFYTPLVICWSLFFIFLLKTTVDFRKQKISFIALDILLFAVIGIVGVLIAYISFFSDHHAARNYNLLWAVPAHLPAALLLPFSRRFTWLKNYFLLAVILAAIAFIGGFTILPQKFNAAFYPVMLTIGMRGWMIWKK